MSSKTLSMPEDVIINMLQSLPEDTLTNLFWKTMVKSDVAPFSQEEIKDIQKGKIEFEKGETISWENIR
ncbi:hypothetical protein M1N02_03130 [Thermodesulfovibrionales bacterium]|nr:hypothetical protein [Thermodesulfovibrionales bacterium]MCL0040428.1 hypothetical protein [Thermodesulfovibrionales bacterium]MCL0067270.1 hypothetical protein [Thermodesulfovibrionales bacterium]MCL0083831.1 hypothetical protein [Thermodesulfovibrionales bacterium]